MLFRVRVPQPFTVGGSQTGLILIFQGIFYMDSPCGSLNRANYTWHAVSVSEWRLSRMLIPRSPVSATNWRPTKRSFADFGL